jgi:hypothetical protein
LIVRLAGGEQRGVARKGRGLIDKPSRRDGDRFRVDLWRQITANDFVRDHHHRQPLVGDERALVIGF